MPQAFNKREIIERLKDIQASITAGHIQRARDKLDDLINQLGAGAIIADLPLLGLATCEELLKEISARIEVHGPGLQYKTVGG